MNWGRWERVDLATVLFALSLIVVIMYLTWELWVPHHWTM